MKRFISQMLSVVMLLSLLIASQAQAASVVISVASGDRQNFTIDLPAGVDLAGGETITLRLTTTANGTAVDLDANSLTSAILGAGTTEVLADSGTTAGFATITATADDTADGADLVFVLTSALTDNLAYTINYRDSLGNFGAAMINFGTANQVSVTATVEPILQMAITNTAIDLGVLTATAQANSGTDTNVAVITNAASGYSILASATNFIGSATANVIPFLDKDAQATGAEGFSLDVAAVNAVTNPGSTTLTAVAGFNGAGTPSTAISGTGQTIASATGPAGDGSIDVNYSANISVVTEADAYSTTVTYTVTGSF